MNKYVSSQFYLKNNPCWKRESHFQQKLHNFLQKFIKEEKNEGILYLVGVTNSKQQVLSMLGGAGLTKQSIRLSSMTVGSSFSVERCMYS